MWKIYDDVQKLKVDIKDILENQIKATNETQQNQILEGLRKDFDFINKYHLPLNDIKSLQDFNSFLMSGDNRQEFVSINCNHLYIYTLYFL